MIDFTDDEREYLLDLLLSLKESIEDDDFLTKREKDREMKMINVLHEKIRR